MKKYNIGLDVGTSSVGWAVVDDNTNEIIRKGNKKLWGVNLFDMASTAEARRMSRNTRRRYDRRRKRIKLLQNEFKDEIDKVDKSFYVKLNESFYNEFDEINKTVKISTEERNAFNKYMHEYPTIYHLREHLVSSKQKMDIRLVYLAIHHIIKYRGNFLKPGDFKVDNIDISSKLKEIFEALINCETLEFDDSIINFFDYNKFENIIYNESKKDRLVEYKKIFSLINDNFAKEIANLLVGNKSDICKLFNIECEEKISISFNGTEYDDNYDVLEKFLNNNIEILELIKELYDMIFLMQLFKNSSNTNLSSLMVDRYNSHKSDLKFLKEAIKSNKDLYKKLFKINDNDYDKYINNKLSFDDFKKLFNVYLEKEMNNTNNKKISNLYYDLMKIKIENGTFMPRITDTDNGKYPYQLNKEELIKIIENQGQFYPFLREKINNTYRLVKLLEFKIPYYVGPLNNTTAIKEEKNKNSWAVIKPCKSITPFNFDDVVDLDSSAELFIKRMISHCTYLLNEYAIPADSILYSKFKVMNELKQIRINTYKLSNEFQQKVINELFMKIGKNISNSLFVKYICQTEEYHSLSDIKVTGYSSDKGFANNMKSYCDFFGEDGIFKNTIYTINDAELLIEWITIFEDKSILEKKIRENYGALTEISIKKLIKKKYNGWSSLSSKLLNTKYYMDKKSNEYFSIMDLMQSTDENFMQIINNNKYNFQKFIDSENNLNENTILDYSIVSNLATSPANKKGIYQTLKVIEEIVDYMGYEPNNIILEMARGDELKKRTISKKDQLLKIFNNGNKEYKKLLTELKSLENINMKYYLYFIQEGKSLYSGTPLEIENIDKYEIDHILPRTLIKDNSIDNLALVLREENQIKGSSLVLPDEYRTQYMISIWNDLKSKKLITPKKFYRLTRRKYSDEDIEGFINRQLVETRQITKHVSNIVNNFHKKTKVIYINAGLSHNYRQKFELYKFRKLNDYHHAHDAYLAAVLGKYRISTYGDNFNLERNKEYFYNLLNSKNYRELNYGFIVNSLDNTMKVFDDKTGVLLFDPEILNNTIINTLYRNDIIVTRKSEIYTGEFFQETKNKKGQSGVQLKDNLPTDLYGAYTSLKCSYMCLVKYNNKKKLIGIPYLIDVKSKNDLNIKNQFIRDHLKLKEFDTFEILKDRIPFNTLFIYKKQQVRIKGYSVANKNGEIANDVQFNIDKTCFIKWKDTLNIILNIRNKDVKVDDNYVNEILFYMMDKIKKYYPLYDKIYEKIMYIINEQDLTTENRIQLINELLNMMGSNSLNANLKFLNTKGLDDRVGRMSGISITEGTIVYQSVTGLKQNKYEF